MMGNWNGDGVSTPAVFRPQDATPYPWHRPGNGLCTAVPQDRFLS